MTLASAVWMGGCAKVDVTGTWAGEVRYGDETAIQSLSRLSFLLSQDESRVMGRVEYSDLLGGSALFDIETGVIRDGEMTLESTRAVAAGLGGSVRMTLTALVKGDDISGEMELRNSETPRGEEIRGTWRVRRVGAGEQERAWVESFCGATFGLSSGVELICRADPGSALFSRERQSRLEYPIFPAEGTVELALNVDYGYSYQDFRLREPLDRVPVFTTGNCGSDTWWPGECTFWAYGNGDLLLTVSTSKGDNAPRQELEAKQTKFRFSEWHSVGVSYGSEGQYIRVDGEVVASDPEHTHPLSVGGTPRVQNDIFTIGQPRSGIWKSGQYTCGFGGEVRGVRLSWKQQDWGMSF